MHSRATDRRSASKCQGKWPDQTLDQAFGLPEVLVAVSTSRLSCNRAGKTRTLMPVWDSSGESRINILSVGLRLPTVHLAREFIEAGGLMSYGPSMLAQFRRAAEFVDKILRGAKPADISVEQPTKFELVINLTSAKALGLTIPESFLMRAEVIE